MASTSNCTLPSVANDGLTILFDKTAHSGPKSVEFSVDIVFIHGLNGNPKETWRHPDGFYWPFELHNVLEQSRVMVFGYNSSIQSELATNFIRIKGIAASLNGALANARSNRIQIRRPLLFVCHSMGGLVAKAALVAMAKASVTQANDLHHLYDSVRGFIFFGTPQGGSSVLGKHRVHIIKRMCRAAFVEIPPKLEGALESGSDEILDLAEDFRNTRPFQEQALFIATYYEQLGTAGLSGRVVSEAEATVPYARANPPEPINADHRDMVRFSSLTSGNAANPVGLLRRWETKLRHSGIYIRRGLPIFAIGETSMQPEWHEGRVIDAKQDLERTADFVGRLREAIEDSILQAAVQASSSASSSVQQETAVARTTADYEVEVASFMQDYGDELVQQVDVFHDLEQQTGLFQAMLRLTKGKIDADLDTHRTLMHMLAMNGNVRLLPKLQQLGFLVDEIDSDRRTPLHLAVMCNHFEAVRVLVEECGANPNQKDLQNLLPFNYSLQIDLDNASDNQARAESRRNIIRLLAQKTDPALVKGTVAIRALQRLKENPGADIVLLL